MNSIMPNILENCKRYFLVLATMLLVLLSSCTAKTSIKTLTGTPLKTEQGLPQGNHSSTNSVEKCAELDIADTPIVQNVSFNVSDLLPAITFTAAFLFLFDFPSVSEEIKHPLYSSRRKIRSSIPIFLEYQKLIIHHTC